MLSAKTAYLHGWIVTLSLTEWIHFGLEAEVPGLVIAQIAATLSLAATNSRRHIPITTHEAVRIVLGLATECVHLVAMAEVRQGAVAVA